MEKLSREQLEIDLDDGLFEIVVGGHICLIGKVGYIDWILGSECFCGVSTEDSSKNMTKL